MSGIFGRAGSNNINSAATIVSNGNSLYVAYCYIGLNKQTS